MSLILTTGNSRSSTPIRRTRFLSPFLYSSQTRLTSLSSPPTLSVPKHPKEPELADALFHSVVNAQRAPGPTSVGSVLPLQRPLIVRAISERTWVHFKHTYGESSAFKSTK